jgi:hypothetical protein
LAAALATPLDTAPLLAGAEEAQSPPDLPVIEEPSGGAPEPEVGAAAPGDGDEPEPARETPWRRLPSGRWAVGDEGRQEEVVPLPASPIARPDSIVDGARVNDLTYRAASLRGLSHQQYAKPRQDTFAVGIAEDDAWLFACVADGVSEGPLSHHAADVACQVMTETMLGSLSGMVPPADGATWETVASGLPWLDAVKAVNIAIIKVATGHALTEMARRGDANAIRYADSVINVASARKIMSTTLIAVAVATRPELDGQHPFVVASVAGDSSAFLLMENRWSALTVVKNEGAEVASSAVHPLPGSPEPFFHCGTLPRGACLCLMTDGLGDPLGTGKGAVGAFLAEMWRQPPDLLSFASQLGFLRKTFVDDRTAFSIWSKPDE